MRRVQLASVFSRYSFKFSRLIRLGLSVLESERVAAFSTEVAECRLDLTCTDKAQR
jgi:hypothetical protein